MRVATLSWTDRIYTIKSQMRLVPWDSPSFLKANMLTLRKRIEIRLYTCGALQ